MLLNLNNCSVLKPQGYSSLQSISETEWYELKNILTFVFCWVEKLVLFLWTSPRCTVCWKGWCFGLVNQRWAAASLGLKSPFLSSTKPKPWLQSTFPFPTCAKEELFLCYPHLCLTRGCVCFLELFFSVTWREELGAASRNQDCSCPWPGHVLVLLEPSGGSTEPSAGKDGTARDQPGAGHHQNPERTIQILPNTPAIVWKCSAGADEQQRFKDKNKLHGIWGEAGGHCHSCWGKRSTQPGMSRDRRKMPWSQS